ncbi:MAG: putative membrane protein YkoI [Paraglaciecola sp.]
MKNLVKILLFVTLLTTMNLLGNVVYAQDNNKPIDKSQAAQKAQQKVNGRVLKVDQNKSKYRVKVLQKSGRVVSVDVDKRSGKVSRKKKKD